MGGCLLFYSVFPNVAGLIGHFIVGAPVWQLSTGHFQQTHRNIRSSTGIQIMIHIIETAWDNVSVNEWLVL